jgi:hypothetical protein
VLEGDGRCVGIEVGEGAVLGDPAAVDPIAESELTGLVVELDVDVFAEVGEGDLGSESSSVLPDKILPGFEFVVVGDAALERGGVEFGQAGRFAAGAGVATFAVGYDLGSTFEATHFGDAGDVAAVPL